MKKLTIALGACLTLVGLAGCSTKSNNSGSDPVNPTDPVVTTTYTVTFNTNGGSNIQPQTVESGGIVSAVLDPIKSGYTFDGWYTDEACTESFDFQTQVTTNLVLYAKWISSGAIDPVDPVDPEEPSVVTTYTITFNANGGTCDTSSVKVNENSKLTSLPTPTRDNYLFDGWYLEASGTTQFNINTAITSSFTLYAKWSAITSDSVVTAMGGYREGLYLNFAETNPKSTVVKVEYKKSTDSAYTRVDADLVRALTASTARVDVVGLQAGTYDVKVTTSASKSETKQITVTSDDRSGYAHFDYEKDGSEVNVSEGIGAYNNNGVLKSDAEVVYVDDTTKNTVTKTINGTTYTGLYDIINGATSKKVPLDVRVIGKINQDTWNKIEFINDGTMTTARTNNGVNNVDPLANGLITYGGEKLDGTVLSQLKTDKKIANADRLTQAEIIALGAESNGLRFNGSSVATYETTYTTIDGVEGYLKYDSSKNEYDSYWNMMDIKNASNITIEGIGEDAGLNQWGFTWKLCKSIEVKNLTFDATTEDACAFEGGADSSTIDGFTDGHIWVHNNTFNVGFNNLDVSSEQDKHEGDGSTDIKKTAFVTFSYNRYYKTHKTGLVNGGDSQHAACVTFHHNFYDQCESRLPFARQANMHMYNNYYAGSTGTNMQIYAGAYAFIEGCYFENTNKTFVLDARGKGTPAVKSYNNIYTGKASSSGATVVTDRTTTVTNDNVYNPTFDTSTTDFYYDSTNQVSDVTYLTDAATAKTDCINYAGTLKSTMYGMPELEGVEGKDENATKYTVTFDANGGTVSTSTATVVENGTISTLPTPTRSGYTFDGWFTETTGGTAFTTSTAVTSTITVYAHWTVEEEKTVAGTYSVDFSKISALSTNMGDGYTYKDDENKFTLESGAIKYNSSASVSSNVPTDKYLAITVEGSGTVTISAVAIAGGSNLSGIYVSNGSEVKHVDVTSASTTATYELTFTQTATTTYYIYRGANSTTTKSSGLLISSIVTTLAN